MKENSPTRKIWLWVTKPDYYLDFWGREAKFLNPGYADKWWRFRKKGDWWTCHKDTREGDLALLYRTFYSKEIGSDIGYLLQARGDAYSIINKNENGWKYGCEWKSLYKFTNPVTISDLKNEPYLEDWAALRGNFQRSAFLVPNTHWERLRNLIIQKNPEFKKFINKILIAPVPEITKEEDIENYLIETDFRSLKSLGYDLKFEARQVKCKGHGGRIDILCRDKKNGYVVIELKNDRAKQDVFSQIQSYMGWVKQKVAHGSPVIGLVISRGYDVKLEYILENQRVNDVFYIDVKDIGIEKKQG